MAANQETAAVTIAGNGWSANNKPLGSTMTSETPHDPVFSPACARAAFNKRRMSMQDSIDVTKIDRHMYLDRLVRSS